MTSTPQPRRRPVRRLGLARVSGHSMEPTLHHGDLLLVLWAGRPRPRRLALVRLPGRPLAVKRLVARVPGGWWVQRDNPNQGVDSTTPGVGVIAAPDVVARVVLRLPGRRRRG